MATLERETANRSRARLARSRCLCCPLVDGEKLWYVSNRGEVVCLDTQGFHDGENDGPFNKEPNENKDEADVIWKVDMMKQLGVSSTTCAVAP